MGVASSANTTKLAFAIYNFGRGIGDNSVGIVALYKQGDELKKQVFLSDIMALTGEVQFSVNQNNKLTVDISGYTYYSKLTILAVIG